MLSDEERLTVVNVVASTRVAEELDLPDIAIQLNCEYEPEQFPGAVSYTHLTLLTIFRV